MGNVSGIGGSPGTVTIAPANGRLDVQVQSPAFEPLDGIVISRAASQAAAAQQASLAAQNAQAREQHIEEVRARLQEGAYKLQAALLKVAARVSPYVQ